MTMSDRIAVINDGQLQQCSPPLVCYNQPANTFVAQFIGSPSMNLFDGQVDGSVLDVGDFRAEFDTTGSGLHDGDTVTLGVRPEDIYLVEDADAVPHPSDPVTVSVDVLEPVGDQTYAYLLVEDDVGADDDATEVLMSLDPDKEISARSTVEVVFSRDDIHLFDGESGEAITHSLVNTTAAGDDPAVEGES